MSNSAPTSSTTSSSIPTRFNVEARASPSGITSPKNSIWLRSEQDARIAKVASAPKWLPSSSIANSNKKLVEAWMKSVKPPETMVIEQIGRQARLRHAGLQGGGA